MMYMIHNRGGYVHLYPFDGLDMKKAKIPISTSKVLIFRHDLMSYSYKPEGGSLVLQTWLLSEPFTPDVTDEKVVELPPQLIGERVHIMSTMSRYPGMGYAPRQTWEMFAVGTDTVVKVPTVRFDIDAYWTPDVAEASATHLSYQRHGAFCEDEMIVQFDHRFFKITPEEANVMSPSQRVVLEVGYETLSRGGYNKAALFGKGCGVFLGDSGSDWESVIVDGSRVNPHIWMAQSGAASACRLSHIFGIRGPTAAVDTACSSSLVATSNANIELRKPEVHQRKAGVVSHVNNALAMGIHVLLAPKKYLGYSGATMLSLKGRCFTFDSTADGFCRGEGCGALLLSASKKDSEAQMMLACLVGCAVNQDGRSASMTAPHGPSQQECIRKSMDESGLSPDQITVAETHGTGTALGDPIEVNALRGCIQDRESPVLTTSAKTAIAHQEAGAGIAGITRCLTLLLASCAPPNCHLRIMNPHLDTTGYPAWFETELVDYEENEGISGVSSFGSGGTNGRGDLWGRCVIGQHATDEVYTGQVLDSRQNLYERVYSYGAPGPVKQDKISIRGSWNAWSEMQEMTSTA